MSERESEAPAPKAAPVRIRNYIDALQLRNDLSYSLADLSGAMTNQASMFAHYATLAAEAARQVDDLEMMLDVAKSKVSRKLRDAAVSSGEKTTVAGIEADVLSHVKIIEIRRALNAAKQIESTAKTAVEAFRHRKDMLIQLGAHEREEMKGELRVTAKRTVEEALKEQQARLLRRAEELREPA